MTEQEQTVILEAREILARYFNQNPMLTSWQAVLDYCALAVRGEVECFHVLYLDRKNRLISDVLASVGTVDHVPVYPREVLKRALLMVSRSETARQLLTPGEIMQLPPSEEIVMVAGIPPIRAKKARYYEDPRLTERLLPAPAPKPPDAARPDDWTALPLPARPVIDVGRAQDRSDREDPTDSERRYQPELNRAKPDRKPKPAINEFEPELADETDDEAAQNRRLVRVMRGVARQVAMDPNDNMDL